MTDLELYNAAKEAYYNNYKHEKRTSVTGLVIEPGLGIYGSY